MNDPHIMYNIVLQTRSCKLHRIFLFYRPYVTLIRHDAQRAEIFNTLVHTEITSRIVKFYAQNEYKESKILQPIQTEYCFGKIIRYSFVQFSLYCGGIHALQIYHNEVYKLSDETTIPKEHVAYIKKILRLYEPARLPFWKSFCDEIFKYECLR